MEQVTILAISRPHGTFKWEVQNGLVVSSHGTRDENIIEDPCSPREFLDRNRERNLKVSGRDQVLCVTIMTRHVSEDSESEKPYFWTIDERLDKTSVDIIKETYDLDLENESWEMGVPRRDRIDTMENGDIWICIGGKRIRWDSLKEKVEG